SYVPHLALTDQIFERPERFLEGRKLVDLVDEIDVDEVGAEPLQALLRGADEVPAREARLDETFAHAVTALRGDHALFAPRTERPAEHALGVAAGIHVRRVEEVDACIERAGHEVVRRRLI